METEENLSDQNNGKMSQDNLDEGNGSSHDQPEKTADTPMVPAAELEAAKKELLYLRAEFENYRRQAIEERSELLRYGGERLVIPLLDVLDNFERALNAPTNADNLESFRQGVEMTAREFRAALNSYGVKEVPAEGKPFDPSMHEAVTSIASPGHEPGTVVQVYRSAYTFHDKLIRPAQVVVAAEPNS